MIDRTRLTGTDTVAVFGMAMTAIFLVTLATTTDIKAQEGAAPGPPIFTAAQAEAGASLYARDCAQCHGANLDDGAFAPPLKGEVFRMSWGGQRVSALLEFIETNMPPAGPGSLSGAEYRQVASYLFREDGLAPGPDALPATPAVLEALRLPLAASAAADAGGARGGGPGGGLAAGVVLPPAPARDNPLDRITLVTDATLGAPAPGEWLSWRRDANNLGFSPLTQITRENVAGLRLAWSYSLPPGAHETAPLVHDGVLFVYGAEDTVQAIDAARGERLWEYRHELPEETRAGVKRGIALYGDKVYAPMSDGAIVALDMRTGELAWSARAADEGYGLNSGPVVGKGKVMIGTTGRMPGGNYLVAFDAETGEEAWRFWTIARPGEFGGDTWNDLDLEQRNGASAWVPGSFDASLGLAFFGIAQTYDTGPLRFLADGATSNDALYTDSTLAIDPDTGDLVWYFQHLPNDQWDLDFAFEQQVFEMPVDGTMTKVILTGGKPAVFDAVRADNGEYLFSFDLGLQNVIESIDPATGRKNIAPGITPGDGESKLVCPHAGGAKTWLASSLNPETRVVFIPLNESCMTLEQVMPGGRGSLSTGVSWRLRPPVESDGNYGRLEAVNLDTRETVWVHRQRMPRTTGVLATAGGVVFAGDLNRGFAAYDDRTGEELWRTRLNDVPNTGPISFAIDGKQYVAITDGFGGAQANTFPPLVQELTLPAYRSSSVWVFELPE